jgi:L-lactate dehydrogenase complex protein LldG
VGLAARFADRLTDYGVTVVEVDSGGVAAALADRLRDRSLARLAVPEGFPEHLLPSGPWLRDSFEDPLDLAALDRADGTITLAAGGIAETGTIVLDCGPGQGRRVVSLIPDYHLCLIRPDQIVSDVPEALAALDPRRPITFISGPSATSDIELKRVEGVHGPRRLDVIITDL